MSGAITRRRFLRGVLGAAMVSVVTVYTGSLKPLRVLRGRRTHLYIVDDHEGESTTDAIYELADLMDFESCPVLWRIGW
jgi:hypothetical protein